MTDIFDVIADPTRRQLLTALRDSLATGGAGDHEIEVAEFVEALGVTRPTVVKHLGVLREAGLVIERTDATKRYFALDASPLEELEDWLVPFIGIGGHGDYAKELDEASGFDSAVFAAWSGADVGESIGRQLADRSHQALTVIHDATEKVQKRLPKKGRKNA
jgi:ArsR family transcriptional regulator